MQSGSNATRPGLIVIRDVEVNLTRGFVHLPDGTAVALRRQSAAVQRHLASQRGIVVPKAELFKVIWKQVVVTDDSLVQCISDIRRALGPAREAVRTFPGCGYQLEVESASGVPLKIDPSTRAWLVLAILATILTLVVGLLRQQDDTPATDVTSFDGPVVIVQSFRNHVDSPRWDRLARSITEDVTTDLALNNWLFVIDASALHEFTDDPSRRLTVSQRVNYVVRSTVRAESDEIRIDVMLLEARTGRQLWSKRWAGRAEGLLRLQHKATTGVTTELAASMSGPIASADQRRAHGRGIGNLSADELAQIGRKKLSSTPPRASMQ